MFTALGCGQAPRTFSSRPTEHNRRSTSTHSVHCVSVALFTMRTAIYFVSREQALPRHERLPAKAMNSPTKRVDDHDDQQDHCIQRWMAPSVPLRGSRLSLRRGRSEEHTSELQ